jgi:hypothetical protein
MPSITFIRVTLWLVLLVVSTPAAWAVCSNPSGNEGEIVYNSTYKVPQFCNGTDWVAWGSGYAANSSYFTTVTAVVNADSTGTTTAWSSKVLATCPTGYSVVHFALTQSYGQSSAGTYHYCQVFKEGSTAASVQILNDVNNANYRCAVTALCVKD